MLSKAEIYDLKWLTGLCVQAIHWPWEEPQAGVEQPWSILLQNIVSGNFDNLPDVPLIPNIHRRIFEEAAKPGALNMLTWHTDEAVHCRGGWAIHLAGERGYHLRRTFGPATAAFLIYRASDPENTLTALSFLASDEEALADMQACAEKEADLK